jgi:hypothetical protein
MLMLMDFAYWIDSRNERKRNKQIHQHKKPPTMYEGNSANQAKANPRMLSEGYRDNKNEERMPDFKNFYKTIESHINYNRLLTDRILTSVAKFKPVLMGDVKPISADKKPEDGLVTALLDKAYFLGQTNELLQIIANHLETIV